MYIVVYHSRVVVLSYIVVLFVFNQVVIVSALDCLLLLLRLLSMHIENHNEVYPSFDQLLSSHTLAIASDRTLEAR